MSKESIDSFDTGMRATIELLYGAAPAVPGGLRGQTVRGPARYSADEALRAVTQGFVHRLSRELEPFARRRPQCGYVMAPWVSTCPDDRCQRWIDEIVEWHTARFGRRHFAVTMTAVWTLARGISLSLKGTDGSWRDAFNPAVVALDVARDREWVTASVGIHASASKNDAHALIDRLWPEVERLRAAGDSGIRSRSNGRAGRIDRPARATLWRYRHHEGQLYREIADEWEQLTHGWLGAGDGCLVDARAITFPAWLEWRSRGNRAQVEPIDVATVGKAIAKLTRLTA